MIASLILTAAAATLLLFQGEGLITMYLHGEGNEAALGIALGQGKNIWRSCCWACSPLAWNRFIPAP